MILNGGWYLVVWFPWISSNEVDVNAAGALEGMMYYYAGAFIVTILLEGVTNTLFLKKSYAVRKILRMTLLVNIISYLVGSVALYSYSFRM